MRRFIGAAAILILMAACGPTNAAVQGTGSAGQRNFEIGAFDAVELAGPYDVIVTVGGAPSVRAEGDEAALEQMEIRVEDGRLRIGTRPGVSRFTGNATVHVTAPSLQAARLAGSGDIRVSPLRAAQFRGAVAGSGNLVLQELESEMASFDIAGSGNVRAAGRARQTSVRVAGAGNGDLGGFQTETADISIMGSGDARLHASGTASVSVMGSGSVEVTGGARCSVSKMGSGNVRCG